MSVLKNGHAL